MKLVNMRTFNVNNCYILTGTKNGRKPEYLSIISYANENRNKLFTKYELLLQSNYHLCGSPIRMYSKEIIGNGFMSDLFSAFSHNEILVYDKSLKKWKIGKNFDEWCNQYYPELKLKSNTLETYTCQFLIDKNKELVNEINNRSDIANKDFAKKTIIEAELNSIERSISKIRELLN